MSTPNLRSWTPEAPKHTTTTIYGPKNKVPFKYGYQLVGESEKDYLWREAEYVHSELERISRNMRGRMPMAKTHNGDFDCLINFGSTNANKRFVAVMYDSNDYSMRDFSYGQMEGARRLIKRTLLDPFIATMKRGKKFERNKMNYIIGKCYQLLDYIQGKSTGESQRDSFQFRHPLPPPPKQYKQSSNDPIIIGGFTQPENKLSYKHITLIPTTPQHTQITHISSPKPQRAVVSAPSPTLKVDEPRRVLLPTPKVVQKKALLPTPKVEVKKALPQTPRRVLLPTPQFHSTQVKTIAHKAAKPLSSMTITMPSPTEKKIFYKGRLIKRHFATQYELPQAQTSHITPETFEDALKAFKQELMEVNFPTIENFSILLKDHTDRLVPVMHKFMNSMSFFKTFEEFEKFAKESRYHTLHAKAESGVIDPFLVGPQIQKLSKIVDEVDTATHVTANIVTNRVFGNQRIYNTCLENKDKILKTYTEAFDSRAAAVDTNNIISNRKTGLINNTNMVSQIYEEVIDPQHGLEALRTKIDIANDSINNAQLAIQSLRNEIKENSLQQGKQYTYTVNEEPYQIVKWNNIQAEAGVDTVSIEKDVNTTFVDQRQEEGDQGYMTTQVTPTGNQQSMQEGEYHIRTVLSKPLVAWTKPWSTSDEPGKIIGQLIVPGDLIEGPHYNLMSTFTFFRGTVKVRAQLNTVPFNFGRICLAFCSQYSKAKYSDLLYHPNNLVSMPHIMLDAGISNSGELTIPFNHFKTYFNLLRADSQDFLGTLLVVVFNKLGSTTGASQTVDITLWVSFDNCELHQPSYAHTVALPKTKVYTPIAEAGIEGIAKSVLPHIADIVAPHATGFLGNVAGAVSQCDKPTDPVEITRFVPNTVTSLNFGDGLDRANRLSLMPGTATVTDSDIVMTTTDDMNLKLIAQIPTRLFTLKWGTVNQPGSIIDTWPVYPTRASTIVNSKIDPSVDEIQAPLVAYCSRPFKYYRGGLNWKIQVIANLMMSGRLQISFIPSMITNNFSICNYSNTIIMDLQQTHEIEFTTPYMTTRPWLRCDKFSISDVFDDTMHTGSLAIHVVNRLTVPDASAQVIDINVFVSASDDFELACPADLSFYMGTGTPVKTNAEASVQTISGRDTQQQNIMSYQGGVTLKNVSHTLSENAMDLKTLLRRYSLVYTNLQTNSDNNIGFLFFDNTPTLSSVNKSFNNMQGIQTRTPQAHFGELFTFWRGSLRYKLVFTDSSNVVWVKVFHTPGAFYTSGFQLRKSTQQWQRVLCALECQGVMIASARVQNSMEFEIPFYTPYTQLRAMSTGSGNIYNSTGSIVIVIMSAAPISTDLYQSVGDDFCYSYLRAAPKIQFEKTAEDMRETSDNAQGLYQLKFLPLPPIIKPSALSNLKQLEGLTLENPSDEVEAEAGRDWIPRNPYTVLMDTVSSFRDTSQASAELISGIAKRCGLRTENGETGALGADDDAESDEPLTTMQQFLEMIPNLLNSTFKIGVKIAVLVSGFQAYLTANNVFVKACAIVTIAKELLGSITKTITPKLMPLATTIINMLNGSKQGNGLPRAESDIFSFIPALVAVVTTGLIVLGFKNIPDDKDTQALVQTVSNKLRLFNFTASALSNVKACFTQMKEMVEWILDQILMLCAPQYLAQLKLQRGFEDIEQWAVFIDSLETQNTVDRTNMDAEFRKEVLRACEKGHTYTQLLVTGKIGREASIIREYARKALEWEEKVKLAWQDLPVRRDPLCVAMVGTTSVGKSGIIGQLANDMMSDLKYPLSNRWCPINPTEQFFTENYRHQTAIYIDDFSMFNTEEQYKTFMNLKSNNDFPLNMAFRKGVKFNSDFIFMTSNTKYPQPNFVTNIEALHRRRDILIEADFINEETKRAVFDKEPGARKDDNSHLRFKILSPFPDKTDLTGWMCYEDLMEYCVHFAKCFFSEQNKLVIRSLTNLGYDTTLITQAHAGVKMLDLNLVMQNPLLRTYTEELYQNLLWSDSEQRFMLNATVTDEEILEEYRDFDNYRQRTTTDFMLGTPSELDRALNACLRMTVCQSVKDRIRNALSSLKDKLLSYWELAKEKLPFIKILETWPAKLAGVCIALVGCAGLFAVTAHKCSCYAVRRMGYRCRFCGRWPQLEDCYNKQWMLEEWEQIYSTEPYTPRKTSLKEEQEYFEFLGEPQPESPLLGTKQRATPQLGPYSDITRGARTHQVLAHHGPYNQEVKASPTHKVLAHVGHNAESIIDNRISNALYRVRVTYCNQILSINALAVGGRWVLMQRHFTDICKKTGQFEILHNTQWMKIIYNTNNTAEWEERDLVAFNMPIQFHMHKSLAQHFIKESDLSYIKKTDSVLVTQGNEGRVWLQRVRAEAIDEIKYNLTLDSETNAYFLRGAWKYHAVTGSGTCGSVLVALNDKVSGCILGLHSAGSSYGAYASLITREMIEKHITIGKLGSPIPKAEAIFTHLIPEGHIGRIGCAAPGEGAFQPTKTQIIPTPIQGLVAPVKTEPAVLHQRDPRLKSKCNILTKCIEKYNQTPIPFNTRHREMIRSDRRAEFETWELPRTPRPLTLEEAIAGIPLIEGFEKLPLNTSPGYPYTLTRDKGESGKAYLFNINEEGRAFSFKDTQLETLFNTRHSLAKLGERVCSIWTCCLKDERRPLEKVASGSTRLFVIPPVDYSILSRMYTLDYTVAVKNNRYQSHCKLGINCESLEWTELYNYLATHSPMVFAGDFSKYDGTLPPDLTEDFYLDQDYFYKTYGADTHIPEHSNIRHIICDEGIHTICLANREFFMTHTGNKSGNPETVVKNSDINDRLIKLAFLTLAEERSEEATLSRFHNLVRVVTYGDDNIISVKAEIASWFNQESVSEFLARYGITYTNAQKTGTTKMETLDEVTFLKQTFSNHETIKGIKVPRIAEQTITELLNWTRQAPDEEILLKDNITDSLRFAYFYGQTYFNNLRNKIRNALNAKNLQHIKIFTYEDFHYWFLFTIGILEHHIKPEAFFEHVAASGNTGFTRSLNELLLAIPYHFLHKTRILERQDKQQHTDSRYAIAIPSGEGKSWLCRHYPKVFVDHDELLLPAAARNIHKTGLSLSGLWEIFSEEFPETDRRILLVHHPENTKRQILGTYMLPKPNYIRANTYQRLRLKDPQIMDRDTRNSEILSKALKAEPQLFL